ncbi:MAG: 30S ribosomal protein S6 [Deltaproteobacteria bacterium]|nr:30S ribosomal protein S6 [Deltaproteobacteria bacterium]
MRRYETIFIIDPDLSEEGRAPLFERLKDLFPQHNGLLVMVDEWGAKKLAYDIKKKARGYYVRLDYCGTGILVNEIERFFRIDDRVLKYMTVLLEENVDIETVKEEIARAEAEKAQSEKSDKSEAAQNDESDADTKPSDTPKYETVGNETTSSVSNVEEI